MAQQPTIILIHGAFADASGWRKVAGGLRRLGYVVYAPANPLRGLHSDAEYVRSFAMTIDGPVVLVGHSYGGGVITNAGAGLRNARALVFVAAYAPEEGETLDAASALSGGTTALTEHLVSRAYPGSAEGDADGYIDPAYFRELFCADVPRELASFMAEAQRGVVLSALVTPSGVPGWRTVPSWYQVSVHDAAIPPEAERAMAVRAGARVSEVDASHAAMISRPEATLELILAAIRDS